MIWWCSIPLGILLLYIFYRQLKQFSKEWQHRTFLPSERYLRARLLLRIGAYALICFALTGPYFFQNRRTTQIKGRQIYFLLDVSASMNTQDVLPSRLAFAKRAIRSLINEFEGNDMGLITFTDDAYVQCPLTMDKGILTFFLDMSQTGQFTRQGTQYRNVLGLALDRFIYETPSANKGQRVVVLFSDGEDFGDTYTSLIDRYRRARVSIIPVGIGTLQGAVLPGKQTVASQAAQDTRIVTKLNERSLIKLAETSGSTYIALKNLDKNFKKLVREIRQISMSSLEREKEQQARNTYQLFTLIALLLLLVNAYWLPTQPR